MAKPAAVALVSVAVVMAVFASFAWLENARDTQARRLSAIEYLSTLRARLESEVNGAYQGLQSLAILEAAFGGLTGEQFEALAGALRRGRQHVRNVALSRGNVIVYVEPVASNEAALGLDYRNLPDTQWPAYNEAMTSGKSILAGPVTLVQGGRAVILRIPVLSAEDGSSRSIGMVSAPMMLRELLDASGIDPDDPTYALAIRGVDARGADGAVFFGEPQPFDQDPEALQISVPGGSWQIAAMPRAGWARLSGISLSLLLVGALLACVTAPIAYWAAIQTSLRRRQQQVLAESEARFRDFAGIASDGFWEMGPDLRVTSVSGPFYDRLGSAAERFIGKMRTEVALKPGTPDWERHRRDLDARKPFRSFRYEVRDDLAGRLVVEVSGLPLFDKDGAFKGYRGTVRDITQSIEAEERSRIIIDSALDAIVSIDDQGRLVEFNPAAEGIFGYNRAEVLGKQMADLMIPPRLRSAHIAGLRRLSETGQATLIGKRIELEALHADGNEFPVELAIVESVGGGRAAYTAFLRDITERRRAELALSDSERRYRTMISTLGEGIIMQQADGHIVASNRKAEEILGLSTEQLEGRNSKDLRWRAVHEDGSPFSGDEHPALVTLRSGEPCRDVVMGVSRSDGTSRWISVNSEPIFDDGGANPSAVITSFLDITEQRLAEEQLRQAQKMEAVGQLTGGIAHDFNNLLAVISGNLELVDERLSEPEAKREVAMALRAANRGAALTRRLLAFSRRAPLTPVVANINDLVRNLEGMLRTLLGETIRMEVDLSAELRPVQVDPAQLEGAILNLALNARDAMRRGGRLIVETRNIELDADAAAATGFEVGPGRYVTLCLRDSGIGMSTETLERAFEPFFTTKGVGEGSGLGLSMVYGFVKQSGGHMAIESAPGRGTTVRLYLPESPDEVPQAKPPAERAAPGSGQKILVVEDEHDVRDLLVAMLRALGYRALSAPDGPAALTLLEAEAEVALLVTDVVLPGGLSGTALASRALDQRPELKVLFISGYPRDAMQSDGTIRPGDPILAKPFRRAEFAAQIEEILARRPEGP